MTPEQWTRVDQIRELVKQEGDAQCEAAFDDLAAEITLLRSALIGACYDEHRIRRHSLSPDKCRMGLCRYRAALWPARKMERAGA